jgi:hypothetical protein
MCVQDEGERMAGNSSGNTLLCSRSCRPLGLTWRVFTQVVYPDDI